MPRYSPPPTHPIARVRAWFGLTIADLALYLSVSAPLIFRLETGARRPSIALLTRLQPLLQLLPPADEQAQAAAAAAAEADCPALELPAGLPGSAWPTESSAADADALDFRRRAARAQAARLLREAAALSQQARVAARWAAALPALLPPDPDEPAGAATYANLPPDPDAPTRAQDHARWLRGWLRHRAQPLPPAAVTHYYRLRAQAAGLLVEAAALALIPESQPGTDHR